MSGAILIVASNHGPSTFIAPQTPIQKSISQKLTFDDFLRLIGEPKFTHPIYANDVCKYFLLTIDTFLANLLNAAVQVGTQETLNFFGFLRLIRFQFFAAIAKPGTIWQAIFQFRPIARLVHCNVAQFTNDEFIIFVVFRILTHITDHVLFGFDILWAYDCLVRIFDLLIILARFGEVVRIFKCLINIHLSLIFLTLILLHLLGLIFFVSLDRLSQFVSF